MNGFFQDDKGNKSMMRLITFMAAVLGGVGFLAGIVAYFVKIPEALMMVTAGGGMLTLGEGAKLLQKMQEK